MRNILVIKLRYIGDVLLTAPVFRSLKAAFPAAKLTAAVNRGTEEMLKRNPDVDEVLVVEKGPLAAQRRFLSDLRRRRFDRVIDLTDGDRSALLSWFSGAAVRIGFNDEHRWRGLLYSSVVKSHPHEVHRIDRNLAALRALGIQPKASAPVLSLSPEDEQAAERLLRKFGIEAQTAGSPRLVMLHPGARYWFKAWPAERFAELADRLTAAFDCRILIGGDCHDREVAEAIRKAAHATPTILAGEATLLEYAAILKRCALFVGNDSGAMHIATAVGTPVVALFGPSNPLEWGPRGGPMEVLYKGLDCRICFHPTCRRGEWSCMRLISVDEVFAAGKRLIE